MLLDEKCDMLRVLPPRPCVLPPKPRAWNGSAAPVRLCSPAAGLDVVTYGAGVDVYVARMSLSIGAEIKP